jgi:hypothetical protein
MTAGGAVGMYGLVVEFNIRISSVIKFGLGQFTFSVHDRFSVSVQGVAASSSLTIENSECCTSLAPLVLLTLLWGLCHRSLLIFMQFLCSCLKPVPSSRPRMCWRATRKGPSRLAVAFALPLAAMTPCGQGGDYAGCRSAYRWKTRSSRLEGDDGARVRRACEKRQGAGRYC